MTIVRIVNDDDKHKNSDDDNDNHNDDQHLTHLGTVG